MMSPSSSCRRQAREWDVPSAEPPEPTRLGEVAWLEPFPDALLEGAIDVPLGPEARYEQAESISLAFVTAPQLLPPRQLAVLILRDVLGFHANEAAEMLDSTVESVNSARRPDLRHDPLREQRAAILRATAIAPRLMTSCGTAWVSGTWAGGPSASGRPSATGPSASAAIAAAPSDGS